MGQRPQVNGQWAAVDRNLNCKLVHMIATSPIHVTCMFLLSVFASSCDHSVCGQEQDVFRKEDVFLKQDVCS